MNSHSRGMDKDNDSDLSENENKTYYDKVTKSQHIFDEEFGLISRGNKRKSSVVAAAKLTQMKKKCASNFVTDFIPILKWLPEYDIKKNLMNDMIGGFTVGIMHVPQGMAYAALAGVRPVNGLYTSLFPALVYMILGTSRHVSLGVFAVVSLMAGSCNLQTTQYLFNNRYENVSTLDPTEYETIFYGISIEVVTTLTLVVGIVQIAMGVLRLDFLISFMSDQVIAGFTTGAAVHVFTAQLDKTLGVSLPRHNGIGKLFFIYQDLAREVLAGHGNLSTFVISVVVIAILMISKNVIDPIVKKRLKTKLPIPYDLIVIIAGTIASKILDFESNYNVKVIGDIPTGLPVPALPNFSIMPLLLADAIAISVVILVITISMGKLFAKKHNYEIDVRQEFYALGIMECIISIFPVWPSSTALARTLVYEAAGTKTQLATVFSSLLLLLVIFWIGPFVEILPTCFLACIIIVALKGMFMNLNQLGPLWKVSKPDAFAFLVAFFATVICDVILGLGIAVAFALGQIVIKTQRTQLIELGRMSHSKGRVYFQPIARYRDATVKDGVSCLRFSAPLIFLNVEDFRKQLQNAIEAPSLARRKHLEMQVELKKREGSKHSRSNSGTTMQSVKMGLVRENDDECISNKLSTLDTNKISLSPIHAVVLDMSAVPFIDFMGANTIVEVFLEHKKMGVDVFLSGVSLENMAILESLPKFQEEKIATYIFPSIEDALTAESEGIKTSESA